MRMREVAYASNHPRATLGVSTLRIPRMRPWQPDRAGKTFRNSSIMVTFQFDTKRTGIADGPLPGVPRFTVIRNS